MTDLDVSPVVTLRLLKQLKACGKRRKLADSTGVELSGISLLIRTLALRSYLQREVFEPGEERVGIFLPPSAAAVATNFALALANRVSVNLNYTANSADLKECSRKAGLKHVLTSRKFMDKMQLDVGAPLVYLEDIRTKISLGDKLFAALNAKLRTADGLHRSLGLDGKTHDDPLTVIFTSGSTGIPKGVVLTGRNISSNIEAIEDAIRLDEHDTVLGILPFFHSFGFTVTLWSGLTLPCSTVFHYSPLEARPIGLLAKKYGATVLLATPTFLRSYIRRVEPDDFASLEIVVVGAEKMPVEVADQFELKFGVRPVEGYGTTELSPLVSVNIPACREPSGKSVMLREGSVGKPVVRVEARVVSSETDQPMTVGEQGLLEIRGPNVMPGYLDEPEMTAEVMHDEWYRTGDMARIDADGFIEITGRLSRFSKIGGEMVPHIRIEQIMCELVGMDEEGRQQVAITSLPDEKRGEKLIVLYAELPMPKDELLRKMSAAGLPNLYLPSEDCFVQVDEVPFLGSGKLDLKRLREVAEEHLRQRSFGK